LEDVYYQLPFILCYNNILSKGCQDDIARYVYCSETGTQSYPGTYKDQPKLWIEKYFIIKTAMSIRKKILSNKKGK
tara:strand:+ start:4896 stop:5123 length:228 start_codon:yes stop_codon:yes gene_type:complete